MITHNIATTEDGTIQITFTIPYELVKKNWEEALEELGKNMTIPGFRKGMAPKEKVAENIANEEVVNKTLSSLLPKALSDVVTQEKLAFALYPKLELVSAKENEPWQVRAITCVVPTIELGNYHDAIVGEAKVKQIWTPGKAKDEKPKEKSQAEKETFVLTTLIKTTKTSIPKLLIEEEINARLAQLLERIEKLGLNLDNYLASVGKTPDQLRKEYGEQVRDSLTIELALNKIAEKEKIEITDQQIQEAIRTASTDPKVAEELKKPEQKAHITAVLKRQQVLSGLTKLL